MKSRIFKIFAAVTTLAALAGCGGGGPKPPTIEQKQAQQAQQISEMQAKLATTQQMITSMQVAAIRQAVDKSSSPPAIKSGVDAILDKAATATDIAPITTAIKDYLASQPDPAATASASAAMDGALNNNPLLIAQTSIAALQSAVTTLAAEQAAHTADLMALDDVVNADAAAIQALTKQITDLQATVAAQGDQLTWLYQKTMLLVGFNAVNVGATSAGMIQMQPANIANLPAFDAPVVVTLTVDGGGLTFNDTGTNTATFTFDRVWQIVNVGYTGSTPGTWTITATSPGLPAKTITVTVN